MTLKKLEVFEDKEGNLFRTEAEYAAAQMEVKRKKEAELKNLLLTEMMQTIFPRYKRGSVLTEDSVAAEKVIAFMARVPLDELEAIGTILVKYKNQKYDDIMDARLR